MYYFYSLYYAFKWRGIIIVATDVNYVAGERLVAYTDGRDVQ
jgi:hypothetical protein